MTLSVVGGEARMPVHNKKRIRSGAWGRWHNRGGLDNKKAPGGAVIRINIAVVKEGMGDKPCGLTLSANGKE